MNILERLDKEITQQTRNGRTEIYVSTDDLEELGMSKFKNKGRVCFIHPQGETNSTAKRLK